MSKLYELQQATKTAAQDAFANKLINKNVFHRITDGTVSKYDLSEAAKLVQERRALFEARKADHPNDPKKWKALEKSYQDASRLEGAIKRQYEEQGFLDTTVDNQKDWWNGSAW
jgi:hypothetical protein